MSAYGITDGAWKPILEHRDETCVSLFMPTYRAHGDARQDPIRLRNLLRDAERLLVERGVEPERAAAILRPVHDLNADESFWKKQRRGLAVFCASDFFRAYHLPIEVRERVEVAGHFYLRPLMPLHQTRGRFYVLALSLNRVRLFEGRRDEIFELDLEGFVPGSFDDALGYDQYDSTVQVHSTSTSGPGRQPGMVHGHGDDDQEKLKKDVLRYFQLVAEGLTRVVRDKSAPLVLAAVEEHFPLFRSANRHPRLVDGGIPGNPDALAAHELYDKAWELVEPWLLKARDEALERFTELRASAKVSSGLEDVVRAAEQGRVDVLLLAEEPEVWGAWNPDHAGVEVHRERQSGDDDLLELAAASTLTFGGTVFTVTPDRLPDGGPAAAVYRY